MRGSVPLFQKTKGRAKDGVKAHVLLDQNVTLHRYVMLADSPGQRRDARRCFSAQPVLRRRDGSRL
jgi:hypothetical protein